MSISQCAFINANSPVHEYITRNTGNIISDKNLGREADIFREPVKSNFAEKSFWTQAREQVDMKYHTQPWKL